MIKPVIKFSNQLPITKTVFEDKSVGYGSLHVTVYSDVSGTGLNVSGVGLVYSSPATEIFNVFSDSIGDIDNVVQTDGYTVDFDVTNITNYGSVIVSAVDVGVNTSALSVSGSVAYDSGWTFSSIINKKINLTNYLTNYDTGTEVHHLVEFFEDYLNVMYEDKDDLTNKSILQKIESIRDFNDPSKIDMDYINFFAKKLGYSVDLTRGELGTFSTEGSSDYENLTPEEKIKADAYLRLVVKNLPNWYKIKTTKNAVKIMLYSFGIIGDLVTMFSDDYKDNWRPELEYDTVNIGAEMPFGFYPTPHFSIQVNLKLTPPSWSDNISEVISSIDSIRPVNTVFDNISGLYQFELVTIPFNVGMDVELTLYIDNVVNISASPVPDYIQDSTTATDYIQNSTTATDYIQDIT